jgi:hypothetical protein
MEDDYLLNIFKARGGKQVYIYYVSLVLYASLAFASLCKRQPPIIYIHAI